MAQSSGDCAADHSELLSAKQWDRGADEQDAVGQSANNDTGVRSARVAVGRNPFDFMCVEEPESYLFLFIHPSPDVDRGEAFGGALEGHWL